MSASAISVSRILYLSAPGDDKLRVAPLLSNKSWSSFAVTISSVTLNPIIASGVEVNLETTSVCFEVCTKWPSR